MYAVITNTFYFSPAKYLMYACVTLLVPYAVVPEDVG